MKASELLIAASLREDANRPWHALWSVSGGDPRPGEYLHAVANCVWDGESEWCDPEWLHVAASMALSDEAVGE